LASGISFSFAASADRFLLMPNSARVGVSGGSKTAPPERNSDPRRVGHQQEAVGIGREAE